MIAAPALALLVTLAVSPADTPAWRESFLVLGTGRAPYRALYEPASRRLRADLEATAPWLASVVDPAATREWLVLQRVAADAGTSAGPPFAAALAAAPNDTARWPILIALAATGDTRQAPVIAALLASTDRRLRSAAAVALGDLATMSELPVLIAALGDSVPAVRRASADAIERLARRTGAESWSAVVRKKVRRGLATATRDADPWTRRNATRALALIRP